MPSSISSSLGLRQFPLRLARAAFCFRLAGAQFGVRRLCREPLSLVRDSSMSGKHWQFQIASSSFNYQKRPRREWLMLIPLLDGWESTTKPFIGHKLRKTLPTYPDGLYHKPSKTIGWNSRSTDGTSLDANVRTRARIWLGAKRMVFNLQDAC